MVSPVAWNPDLPLIRMREVVKKFGAATVLDGISLDVMKGQVICIIGPSGAGKSTLIRCINALVPIDSGSILVEGQEVNDPMLDKLALRRKVGMVFQQYNLFPHRTALANIMMAPVHVLKRKRADVAAQARALMRKVGLDGKEDFYPGELSGGQQQRVAIARSLAMQPDVMLFDEVTAALDPETVKEVLVTIRELAEEGMTCVIVTHEMGFAREVADEIYFTDRGVVVEHGPPADFFTNCRDERTRRFLSQNSLTVRLLARPIHLFRWTKDVIQPHLRVPPPLPPASGRGDWPGAARCFAPSPVCGERGPFLMFCIEGSWLDRTLVRSNSSGVASSAAPQ